MLIDIKNKSYSLRKQCELLGINRSTLYYKQTELSERDQIMMNLLDIQYTKTPFYGVRKMKKYLCDEGYKVGKDHVRTLLRSMGLCAVYAKPNTSKPHPEHIVYPYLLKGVDVNRPNQVWCADITYIRLTQGFAYLVAILDWNSRYVLSWRLSNSLDADFCIEALEESLNRYVHPEIFNTDQGSQFTSNDFIDMLKKTDTRISMDGRGRFYDNIFVERFWRSLKYECIYLNDYRSIPEVRESIRAYIDFYNKERYHQSLDYKTPFEVYNKTGSIITDYKESVNIFKEDVEDTEYSENIQKQLIVH